MAGKKQGRREREETGEFAHLSSTQRLWLTKLGILTRKELLFYFPRRHEDRSQFGDLREAKVGDALVIRGRIASAKNSFWRGGKRVFDLVLLPEGMPAVGSGRAGELRCRWYNMAYLKKALVAERELIVFGRLFSDKKGWLMTHPEFELVEHDQDEFIHLNRITPVYPLTEGVPQRGLRKLMFQEVMQRPVEAEEFYPVPEGLMPLTEAIPAAHFPDQRHRQRLAMKRLVYDEFFSLQCLVVRRKKSRQGIFKKREALRMELVERFLKDLPYAPTGAQRRVIREMERDLQAGVPMHRLLQGDVGSGKTLIAVVAMLLAVERGQQAALMAPTEILAEQHFLNLRRWLEPLGVSVGLHTGSRKTTDRSPLDDEAVQQSLFQGRGAVVVGTHALLYDSFVADRLGLVVIDEQHKFGVMQRLSLVQKAQNPDVLVMTATPIPRTLGMTLYGDLEVSVLDEMPPGRSPILTARRSMTDLPRVWKFLKEEASRGRQAYVVYPLIEESEKIEAKAVEVEYEKLKQEFFPHEVGLLHGRMRPEEKERVMRLFRENKIQVLVSTPVIEVGVDVPNATLMVIENAERFGLAQLHQLRGRIGRGAHKSYCALIGEPKSLEGWQRLKIMEESCDGFRIAEEDYRIRGPGNIFGTEQSGLPPLRVGDLLRDFDLLQQARRDAEGLLTRDPELSHWPKFREVLDGISAERKTMAAVG